MKRFLSVTLGMMICPLLVSTAAAGSVSINFDVDASNNAINAPADFDHASPLHNTYAALGVHFAGPTSSQGGGILNDSTFTNTARSGHNFLALSNSFVAPDFVGPETISFDAPMSFVSIWASCFSHPMTVTMQAFDAGNVLLDTNTVGLSGSSYSQLSVTSGSNNINSVVLTITGANNNASAFDDLFATMTAVPEPSTLLMLSGGSVMLLARRRKP